jgi:hypothetical protein
LHNNNKSPSLGFRRLEINKQRNLFPHQSPYNIPRRTSVDGRSYVVRKYGDTNTFRSWKGFHCPECSVKGHNTK